MPIDARTAYQPMWRCAMQRFRPEPTLARLILPLMMIMTSTTYAAGPGTELTTAVNTDYHNQLAKVFDQFHRQPELSLSEVKTSALLAQELREAGFTVTTGIGQTGIVALLKNGAGPTVMVRTDMDALPVEEKSGLPNASTVHVNDENGERVAVSHACGHDVHMTSLIGTARQMAKRRAEWSGTLMLIGQPAEEIGAGAEAMMRENLWQRFDKPDYALALHVIAGLEAGKVVVEQAPWSGVDTLKITVHGIGAHASAPSKGKDPIVLGAMIVVALQEIISREISPFEPAVITVGAFHGGTKSNIIGDSATLDLSVRSNNPQTRQRLLNAIKRVSLNMARAMGIGENLLPEIVSVGNPVQATSNDETLRQRLLTVWTRELGTSIVSADYKSDGMYGEDFYHFTSSPYIPSVYFKIGGTPLAELQEAARQNVSVPSNHSPLFRVDSETAIKTGVMTTVTALLDLMKKL